MVKVLKSFTSAHDSVNWMTQNRIENTSIEMTGTLKSLGVVKVPSGNYHVVLKGNPSFQGQEAERAAGVLEIEKRLKAKPGDRNLLDEMNRLTGGGAGEAADPSIGEGRKRDREMGIVMDSISHEDLVKIITKSVMDVLKVYGVTPKQIVDWSGMTIPGTGSGENAADIGNQVLGELQSMEPLKDGGFQQVTAPHSRVPIVKTDGDKTAEGEGTPE
jgi:hypothetical protein